MNQNVTELKEKSTNHQLADISALLSVIEQTEYQ